MILYDGISEGFQGERFYLNLEFTLWNMG